MSMEAASAFRTTIGKSSDLQAQVAKIWRVEDLIALGAEHGFVFTAQEATSVVDSASAADELSEFELDLVAGGQPICCYNCDSGGPK